LIGSVRRECIDHLIVFNAEHLGRILAKYVAYYNEVRTHVSLGKDTPCTLPIERFGDGAALMDAAAPSDSGLAAIVGLRRPILEPILTRHALFIAIVNDVDSFTVGGRRRLVPSRGPPARALPIPRARRPILARSNLASSRCCGHPLGQRLRR
jgi:hypothetical protein